MLKLKVGLAICVIFLFCVYFLVPFDVNFRLILERYGHRLTFRGNDSERKMYQKNLQKYEIISLPMDLECFLNNSPNFTKEDMTLDQFQFFKTDKGKEYKKILAYSYEYGPFFEFGVGKEAFEQSCCKEKRCFMTGRKDVIPLTDFDAVIIHFRSFDRKDMKLPNKRRPKQRYIFYEREAPPNSHNHATNFNGVFNWTMTYRRDSDVVSPYGFTYPKTISKMNFSVFESETSVASSMKSKSKPSVWVVSHCNAISNRDEFVENLKRYLEVDVYGSCGTLKCSVEKEIKCFEMFEKKYKFYLSLENSLCKDYVSEKFFRILRYNIIPVVRGVGDYAAIGPPHSYIDVRDFKSAKHLAEYLIYLDKNDTAYMEYFRWKKDFFVIGSKMDILMYAISFCRLCEKLHQDSEPKVYHDLKGWFNDQAKCGVF